MLQKQYRLPASVRLNRPQTFSFQHFLVKVGKNNLDYNRFGFVVGKKTDKRATARNRIKRVFRSCIEELFDKIQTGHDLLFFVKSSALEIERKEMYNQVYGFLKDKNFLR